MATGLHEKGPVLQFRFVLIVGSAAELDVVGVVRAAFLFFVSVSSASNARSTILAGSPSGI
jgi:hypothetical protein